MPHNQQTREFLKRLFGQCKDSTLTIMTLPDKTIHHYASHELDRFADEGQRLGAVANTYFDVNPKRKDLQKGVRGGSNDVQYLCCLHADIDVAGPAHAETQLPDTKEAALTHVQTLTIQPSVVVDTGYGLQAYWILKEPVLLDTNEIRDKASRTLSGFGKHLKQHFAEKNWKLDSVFDLARMFRFPGSYNFKLDTPVQSRILWDSGIYYALEEFSGYMDAPVPVNTEPFQADIRTVGSADLIMERCPIAQKLLEDPDSVTEPVWHALCSNIALAPDGYEKFQDWSSLYSGYSTEETHQKIMRAQAEKKPCSCAYFRDRLCCDCPEGGCGVSAPIAHTLLTKEEQIRNLLAVEKPSIEEILDHHTLRLMAYAKEHYPAEYTLFKMRVRKSGISIRDFEKAVQKEAAQQEFPEFEPVPEEIHLDGIDLNGARAPRGYRIHQQGVDSACSGKGVADYLPMCNEPMVIRRRMENIDSGFERMELAFHRNGRWKTVIAPRADLLSKSSIIHYSDQGLPVNSCNCEDVVRYLTEYEKENKDVIPFTRSISRIGWLKKEFYPYAVDDEIVFEDTEHTDLVHSLCQNGDYTLWLQTAVELRKNPFSRVFLAASFASPLLEPLQNRVILLHCWHASRSGKTATLKFALSVWGDPMQLMGSFNSTAVGLERRAATLRNLPFGLDELQVLNERKLSPAQIVYSLGNGTGKTRGSRNGKLQETPTWRNCIISTGEQPISSENSMDGVNTRVLELYGQPISNPEYGRTVHQISESNYGFSGKEFILFIQQHVLSQKGRLRDDYISIREELKNRFSLRSQDPGVHLDNIAVLALADNYSSVALFGMNETTAWAEALSFGLSLLANAKSLEPQDSIDRAWDFVNDWIAANHNKFRYCATECYGRIEGQHVYVLANKLRTALEDAGFSYTKSIKGFRERNHLATTTDSDGKERTQFQKRIQGVNTRAFCLNIHVSPAEFEEDDFLAEPA